MRVMVTGHGGFTGRYVSRALQDRGHELVTSKVDVTSHGEVRAAVADLQPEGVVHLAAVAFVHSDAFAEFYAVNQIGTFNLLDALAQESPGARVLLASSANIYGATAGYLDEDTPPTPVNHYAVSKWAMETGAALWRDRLRMTIVRPFNYTGVGQEERYLIAKIVAHFRRRDPEIRLGNLDVQRDFGDVRSVAAAYCGLLEAPLAGGVFNVCTGVTHSIRDVLRLANEITGHHPKVTVDPAFVRPNDIPLLAGNAQRLQAALPDWAPRTLPDTLKWMLFSREAGE